MATEKNAVKSVQIMDVEGQKVPLVTTTLGQKFLVLGKTDEGKGIAEKTLRALFRAGTNPLWADCIRPDGALDLRAAELVLPGTRARAEQLQKSARKKGHVHSWDEKTLVCPVCGLLLGVNGIGHLIQKHSSEGEGVIGLAQRWNFDGYIDITMYADTETLMPIWKAAGATAEEKKKERGTSGNQKPRQAPVEDALAGLI